MSASVPPQNTGPDSASGADPSMEDILASIRRILSEDEAASAQAAPEGAPADETVFALDPSMIVAEPPAMDAKPVPPPSVAPAAAVALAYPAATLPPADAALVAPEAEAAAASSLGALVRTLSERQHGSERQQGSAQSAAVWRGGPTLEDMVREELRPLLKGWLDENLPPLVERLVRTEIERMVRRAVS
jgi:cell pole-organizing protein PopZ